MPPRVMSVILIIKNILFFDEIKQVIRVVRRVFYISFDYLLQIVHEIIATFWETIIVKFKFDADDMC